MFDILGEIESSGLSVSKTSSKGRYGYTEYTIMVSPEVIKFANKQFWNRLIEIKKFRYEMKHNPKLRANTVNAKFARYFDQKKWDKITGQDEIAEYIELCDTV